MTDEEMRPLLKAFKEGKYIPPSRLFDLGFAVTKATVAFDDDGKAVLLHEKRKDD